MKLIMESWRQYMLSEKLVLKPGENGWDLYGELVKVDIVEIIKK